MKTAITILILFMVSIITAQEKTDPCSYAEATQFDFWLGEWECSWKDGDGSIKTGKNSVRKILGGCVIEENFNGNPGAPLIGKSHSVYSPILGKWKQTWVDNNGGYLDFEGAMQNDKMILSRTVTKKDGSTFMQRMVWYNISENEFDWNWERSEDGGESWQVNWQLKYKRKS